MANSPLYIPLPGMEVYIAESLFHRQPSKVRPMHTHTVYELLCIPSETELVFRIIPPFLEHRAEDTSEENVTSMLFSFNQPSVNDICQTLRGIQNEPVSFIDDFHGCMRLQSIRQLVQDGLQSGAYEQIAAELRLLFVCLARKYSNTCVNITASHQTLENKRLAILEDFFSIMGLQESDHSKAKLASLLGVSERQLTRILEQTYHSTFSELMMRTRMRIAQANIVEGRVSLERIAEHVGFRNVDALKRAYKSYFGTALKYPNKP